MHRNEIEVAAEPEEDAEEEEAAESGSDSDSDEVLNEAQIREIAARSFAIYQQVSEWSKEVGIDAGEGSPVDLLAPPAGEPVESPYLCLC